MVRIVTTYKEILEVLRFYSNDLEPIRSGRIDLDEMAKKFAAFGTVIELVGESNPANGPDRAAEAANANEAASANEAANANEAASASAASNANEAATTGETNRAGFAAFYHNDKKLRRAFLSMLVVLPSVQGRTFGTRLLEEVERECVDDGMRILAVEVRTDNQAAVRFYKKRGFKVINALSDKKVILEKQLMS